LAKRLAKVAALLTAKGAFSQPWDWEAPQRLLA